MIIWLKVNNVCICGYQIIKSTVTICSSFCSSSIREQTRSSQIIISRSNLAQRRAQVKNRGCQVNIAKRLRRCLLIMKQILTLIMSNSHTHVRIVHESTHLHICKTTPDSSAKRAMPAAFERVNFCEMASKHKFTQLTPLALSSRRKVSRPSVTARMREEPITIIGRVCVTRKTLT